MRVVIQRVKFAEVTVDNKIVGKIESGLLVFLGIKKGDTLKDIEYLVNKIVNLRIFEDSNGKMNLSAKELNREIMIVSEFTLYGDCRKGFRPNFQEAAPADEAEKLYNIFVEEMKKTGLKIATGIFRAMMDINLINDGPVTVIIES